MPYWISAIPFVFDLQLIRSVIRFCFFFTSLICRFDSPVSEERAGEMLESANTHGCFSETCPISHSSVLAKRTRHKCLLNNQNIPPQRASGVLSHWLEWKVSVPFLSKPASFFTGYSFAQWLKYETSCSVMSECSDHCWINKRVCFN